MTCDNVVPAGLPNVLAPVFWRRTGPKGTETHRHFHHARCTGHTPAAARGYGIQTEAPSTQP